MDISAFEETASDVPDPPLADVKDLVEDDLKYVIAGAIAVVKHVIKLVVLIIALATCVAIYCFLLSWLCLLWLQTRLFLVTAALLRGSMDEPRRPQSNDNAAPHQPESSAVKDQEDESVSPNAAEQSQDPITGKPFMTLKELERRSNATKEQSRPQVSEEWREPSVESAGRTFQGEGVAEGEASMAEAAAAGREAAQQEQEQEQKTEQWTTFGDPQRHPKDEFAFVRETLKGHDCSNQQIILDPESRRALKETADQRRQQHRAAMGLEGPKLSKEQQKAQDQESWLDQLTSKAPPGARVPRAQETPGPSANPFNRGFTAEQLAAAAEFAATATKGGKKNLKKDKPVMSNRPFNALSKVSRSSTPSRPGRTQRVMMHDGKNSMISASSSRPVQGASTRNEATSTSSSISGSIPPHLRKAKEVIAKRVVSDDRFSMAQQASAIATAAPYTGEAQDEVEPVATSVGDENVTPAMPYQHAESEAVEMDRPDPSLKPTDFSDAQAVTSYQWTPEFCQLATTLDFYEETPLLVNPAPRAMSALVLKQWNTPSSSETEVQATRLHRSNGGRLVARPRTSKTLQTSQPSGTVSGVRPAGRADKITPSSSSPAAPKHERPDESNPFMTPPKLKFQTSVETSKHEVNLETEQRGSLQQDLPTAAGFEAALFAKQHRKNLEEQEQKTVPSNEADGKATEEIDESSTPSSKGKASIAQQAVKIIQDQAHGKHASTSTYATAREDATPTHQTSQANDHSGVQETISVTKAPPKQSNIRSSGDKSSKLTPSAPSFFTPAQSSNTAASSGPPQPLFQDSGTVDTLHSRYPLGSTALHPMSDAYAADLQQPDFPSTPHTPQHLAGLGPAYGYTPAPPYNSAVPAFTPQQGFAKIPYAALPGLPQFAPGSGLSAPLYASMSAPSIPSFEPGVSASASPYLPRAASSMPSFAPEVNPYSPRFASDTTWTGQDDVVPHPAEPRFSGSFGTPASHESSAFHTPYQTPYLGNQWPSSSGAATTQPGLGAAMTVPLRRPSLAVTITRPPPTPARPFDLTSENTFPPLPTAPVQASAPALDATIPKPPGLGDPQPSRQTAFNALVREISPRRRASVSSLCSVDGASTSSGVLTRSAKTTQLTKAPTVSKAVSEAQLRLRQPASLKGFSESFKIPASMTPRHAVDDQSITPGDPNTSGGKGKQAETLGEKTFAEAEAKHTSAITEEPRQTVVEGHDDGGDDQELVPASSDKKVKREAKKAAREAVTEAWCIREIARKKVVGSWSPEGAMGLRESTRIYHERRDELESLMGSGKLNDEDAKVFPRFPDLDLSVPKSRPDGAIDAQKKRKDDKTGSPPEAGSSSRGLSGVSGEMRKASGALPSGQSSPLPSELADLKDKLIKAQELLQQARDYKKQPRPQSNVSYPTWKRDGDARIERATKFYRSKREAFAAAFPGGLPDGLAEEFPLI